MRSLLSEQRIAEGPSKPCTLGLVPSGLGSPSKIETFPDLRDPELYLNRELTWLAFNLRVLNEARDPQTPLLERVKFLSIVSSNLDEFFMKRIGGLKQQVAAGLEKLTVDGRSPRQQIVECIATVDQILEEQRGVFESLFGELEAHGIRLRSYGDLTAEQQAVLRRNFKRDVLPLVTPLGFDPAHPFPILSNLSLNLLVELRERADSKKFLARIKVPVGPCSPRFLEVGEDHHFVPLEEVIAHNLDLLFGDCKVESCQAFRVIRNASAERDKEPADDLLAMIEAELRDRRFAPFVRLEVAENMAMSHRRMLASELGLDLKQDVFEADGLLAMAHLMEFASLDLPQLRHPPHRPIVNAHLAGGGDIFSAIREQGSILLQHPKESFGASVERFVKEASRDPKVQAIKATLYRTSEGTRIVDSLVEAALGGKQVAVAVELKARFDEAANVRWARRLEEAGVHVSYGIVGLKTHCKALLVIRKEADGLKHYVHIGTGNYHAGTARAYSDLGLLSCDEKIGWDVADLFNALTTGLNVDRCYRKILTAPRVMKVVLLEKIARETALHSDASPGLIRLKTNALEDPDVVEELYRAGRAGVRVELQVRDTCRLRPGLPGLSESISVTSIVGCFLEHSRVYHFRNGGDDEYFIGSSDLMQRNLEHRVELLVPVEKPEHRDALGKVLEILPSESRRIWRMQADGTYIQSPGSQRRGRQLRPVEPKMGSAMVRETKSPRKINGELATHVQ